jgi:MFS family permease
MKVSASFWKFWCGQTISNLGSSFTQFALPLLVYNLTGSSLDLALVTVTEFVPYLAFGLVIGAWVDRLDRRRLMIACDIGRAVALASVPVLYLSGALTVAWILGVAFVNSVLWIAFSAAEFAAVRTLVSKEDLLTANARIQATYQGVQVLGPLVAGAIVGLGFPLAGAFAIDAGSFLASAGLLSLIGLSFNASSPRPRMSIRADVVEGLRYVLGDPLLRNISLVAALVNLFGITVWTQLVFFAKHQLAATNGELGLLFGAGALGTALMTFLAPRSRRYLSFSAATLGAVMVYGLLIATLALTHVLWVAVIVWSVTAGLPYFFTVHTMAMRQATVPDHMLGRVMNIAQVMAWSANPIGALVGGWAIALTGRVDVVFGVLGLAIFASTSLFWLTALGHADKSLATRAETTP